MILLGLGALGTPEASCCLLRDGHLDAAIEQRKLVRHTPAPGLPRESLREILRIAAVRPDQVDAIAVARPFSAGAALHRELRELLPHARVYIVEHHAAHAASAFYASPFDDASVLTLDRHGDFRCAALWHAGPEGLRLERESYLPDSIGEIYSRVTELLGFQPNADEHKVQWLSTSGDDRFTGLFLQLLGSGWPRIDHTFLDTSRPANGGFSAAFYSQLGLEPGAPIPPALRAPIAAGLQRAVEQTVAHMAPGTNPLCLAGGVAFNALLVASLESRRPVFVQPVAGNAGLSLGAAYYTWHVTLSNPKSGPLPTLALGPEYSAQEIKAVLENCKLSFRRLLTSDELIACVVDQLSEHRIVAWMQGRMEFGSRALGFRSILASPLDPYSTENLNVFIKRRESFRKFAASVPHELAPEYFEPAPNAQFLASISRVRPQYASTFQHALLGTESIRVHTVHAHENPLYHRLLLAAGERTGLPVLYNTSFNLFGDPLVCSPRDAVRSFFSSGIDALAVGSFLIQK